MVHNLLFGILRLAFDGSPTQIHQKSIFSEMRGRDENFDRNFNSASSFVSHGICAGSQESFHNFTDFFDNAYAIIIFTLKVEKIDMNPIATPTIRPEI